MHASGVTAEAIERANRLYWGSSRSVNQIAEDMELSKGALYGIIEPAPSGLGCPHCGDEVVYSNRTAKERERLDCPTCEWDGSPDEATSDVETVGGPSGPGRPERPSGTGGDELRAVSGEVANGAREASDAGGREVPGLDERTPPRPWVGASASTIAGGALLGAAIGLALVMWARRR